MRVKLSSEAAGAISFTPVVVQELPMRELVEHILGVTGKDEPRIGEMLLRGTLVSGASRFRWEGWEADLADRARTARPHFRIPIRPAHFAAGAVHCAPSCAAAGSVIEIHREAAARKGCSSARASGMC